MDSARSHRCRQCAKASDDVTINKLSHRHSIAYGPCRQQPSDVITTCAVRISCKYGHLHEAWIFVVCLLRSAFYRFRHWNNSYRSSLTYVITLCLSDDALFALLSLYRAIVCTIIMCIGLRHLCMNSLMPLAGSLATSLTVIWYLSTLHTFVSHLYSYSCKSYLLAISHFLSTSVCIEHFVGLT